MTRMIFLIIASFFAVVPAPCRAPDRADGKSSFPTLLEAEDLSRPGRVTVWNDEGFLYVRFEVKRHASWLADTHLAVEENLDQIPQFDNEALPYMFLFEKGHRFMERKHTFKIPRKFGWERGTVLYISAQARMRNLLGAEVLLWARGARFKPSDRSTEESSDRSSYFCYVVR